MTDTQNYFFFFFFERFLKLEMPFGFHFLSLPTERKNRGVEKSGNSIIRSVKERKTVALGEENMLFAIEKCIKG